MVSLVLVWGYHRFEADPVVCLQIQMLFPALAVYLLSFGLALAHPAADSVYLAVDPVVVLQAPGVLLAVDRAHHLQDLQGNHRVGPGQESIGLRH